MAAKSKSVKYCSPVGSLATPYDLAIFKDYNPHFGENDVRQKQNTEPSSTIKTSSSIFSDELDLELDYTPPKESLLSYDTKHNCVILSIYLSLLGAGFLIAGVLTSIAARTFKVDMLYAGADLLKLASCLPLGLLVTKHIIECCDIAAIKAMRHCSCRKS